MNGLRTFLFIGSIVLLHTGTCHGQDSSSGNKAMEMANPDSASKTAAAENLMAGKDSMARGDSMEGEDAMAGESSMSGGEMEDTAPVAHHGEAFDLKMGERLFYGLTGGGDNPVNCASCHNVDEIDTLNWNPSAVDIAHSTMNLDSAAFAKKLLNPLTKKLKESHEGIQLSGQEIVLIRDYLDTLSERGLKPLKPDPSKMIFFLVLVVLFMASMADLTLFKKIRYRWVHYLILLATLTWGTKMVAHDAIALGRSKDYSPLQPIKFSHKIHAGEDQIDCQYCHFSAEYSKSAGIPAPSVCLNCHTLIREGTHSGRFEINKIHAAVDSGIPIHWIRIHRLPDFVFFSHAQHVGAGKLDCVECHGPVDDMDQVYQYTDLSMGWCLNCHRTHKVDFLDNDYYGMTFEEFHNKIVQGEIDSVTVEQIGGTDCIMCHY